MSPLTRFFTRHGISDFFGFAHPHLGFALPFAALFQDKVPLPATGATGGGAQRPVYTIFFLRAQGRRKHLDRN